MARHFVSVDHLFLNGLMNIDLCLQTFTCNSLAAILCKLGPLQPQSLTSETSSKNRLDPALSHLAECQSGPSDDGDNGPYLLGELLGDPVHPRLKAVAEVSEPGCLIVTIVAHHHFHDYLHHHHLHPNLDVSLSLF